MSHEGNITIVVLWEEEVRAAAKAAVKMRAAGAGDDDAALNEAIAQFIALAQIALNGAERDEASLAISTVPARPKRRKATR